MPEFSSYPAGTPSWADLGSPDLEGSVAFYHGLLGWEAVETGTPEETGGYRMFTLRGQPVAGVMRQMTEGQPPVWTTYVSVDSADEVSGRVTGAGGWVLVAPMDVMTAGRMAVFGDDAGAVFGVWQPGDHRGAALANEPGAMVWNELMTRAPDAAARFYGAVFGWAAEEAHTPEAQYWTWQLGGRPVGGMILMTDQWPEDLPPSWGVYFGVEDCDAAVARAQELGGSLVIGPMTVAAGRFATLQDPQGAVFSVIAA